MPTYDYECDACKHKFEEFQSINAEPLKKCPQCKKKKLRRLFGGGAAILFKGSGFYQTDYRSDSYKQAAKADQPSTPTDTGNKNGSTGKTESATTGDGGKPAEKKAKSST